MTLEELKAEAKRQGFNLMPIKKKESLLPCTCGCKSREHWSRFEDGIHYEGLRCKKCGKEAWGIGDNGARKAWNTLIREEQEHESTRID